MAKNVRLSEAVAEYLDHLKARGLEPLTIKNHHQPLRRAIRLWGDIYVSSIKPGHIDQLMSTTTWSARTRNGYLSNMRSGFFPWCRRNNFIPKDYDPTEGWRPSKVPSKDKTWMPVEEFPALLDAAPSPRDRVLLAVGLFTMCRGSEVTSIKVRDVDFDRDTLFIYRQKTKEEDVLPMPIELRDELLRWMRIYEDKCGPLQPDWYLVPGQGKHPMAHDHTIGKLVSTGEPAPLKPTLRIGRPYMAVKRTLRIMGLDDHRAGVHLLRRSSARAYYDLLVANGHDHALMRVGAILGHKDTKTTQIYLGLSIERQQRNAMLAGKTMFPGMNDRGTVRNIREA